VGLQGKSAWWQDDGAKANPRPRLEGLVHEWGARRDGLPCRWRVERSNEVWRLAEKLILVSSAVL